MERIFDVFMRGVGAFMLCVMGWFLINKLGFQTLLIATFGGSVILELLKEYVEGRK